MSDDMVSSNKENEVAGPGSSNYVPLQANGDNTAADSVSDKDDKGNKDIVTKISTPATSFTDLTVINDQGICSSCSCDKASDISVSCFRCRKKFHAMCKAEQNDKSKDGDKLQAVICGKTFYGNYTE